MGNEAYGWTMGEGDVDARLISLDSMFTNAHEGLEDYTLIEGSPLIGAGKSLSVYLADPNSPFADFSDFDFTVDRAGTSWANPPSVGALEYVDIEPDPNNTAPVLNAVGDKSVDENGLLTFTLSGSDEDSDALTYSILGAPSNSTFVTDTFTWTPTYQQAGIYGLYCRVFDSNDYDLEWIEITVNNKLQYLLAR